MPSIGAACTENEEKMKTLVIGGAVLTVLLLASTIICGLWIKSHAPVDPSSLQFHMVIGIASALVSTLTVIAGAAAVARLAH